MNKFKYNLTILMSTLLLILIIFINLGFNNPVNKNDKNNAILVIENFIDTFNNKKYKDLNKYMTERWQEKEIQNYFIGYTDIRSISVEKFELDSNYKYLDEYLSKHKSIEETSDKSLTFTTTLNYKYNDKSEYKNTSVNTVFLLVKIQNKWLIESFGTESMFASIN